MMTIKTFYGDDIQNMERNFRRTFINMLSGLKSTHLVGTVDQEGVYNLAIFNSVIHIGANPPLLGCLFRPLTVARHTYENIRGCGYYTFNQVNENMLPMAHATSAKYPKGVSEFEKCGFKAMIGKKHPAPYVMESHIRIGLKYREEHLIAANDTVMLVGEVVEVQIIEALFDDEGFINHEQANTAAVSGLDTYYSAKQIHRLPYAKP